MSSWTTVDIKVGDDEVPIIAFATVEHVHCVRDHRDRVAKVLAATGFKSKPGRWLDIIGDGVASKRVIVIALGQSGSDDRFRSAGGHIVEALRALDICAARLPAAAELDSGIELVEVMEGALLHGFRAVQGRRDDEPSAAHLTLFAAAPDEAHVARAALLTNPINRARAWVERPANLLTPAVFADEAEAALAPLGVVVRKLGPSELREAGAHGILAVAGGSQHEARLTIAEWRGDPDRTGWDVALVGKGVTFDAGGLNFKTRPIIGKMKFDMGGGAAVLGAVERIAALGIRANVVGLVPMTENTIDGKAYRPGDVIASMSGLTIEVQDTDAEGRIILADGVTYAIQEYDPTHIVDIATLTGNIIGVLHEDFAGVFSTDEHLAGSLLQAGEATCDRLWRLPLVASMDYLVESQVADLSNLGAPGWFGNGAGSPVAGAKFIERFARDRSWAHIDMAGTAWTSRRSTRASPGASGFGVALLADAVERLTRAG